MTFVYRMKPGDRGGIKRRSRFDFEIKFLTLRSSARSQPEPQLVHMELGPLDRGSLT